MPSRLGRRRRTQRAATCDQAEVAATRARAETAKAEAAKAQAEAKKAKADAAKAKADARTAKANERLFRACFGRGQEIDSSSRERLVKALGMLGSEHDGERANAALVADKLRAVQVRLRPLVRALEGDDN